MFASKHEAEKFQAWQQAMSARNNAAVSEQIRLRRSALSMAGDGELWAFRSWALDLLGPYANLGERVQTEARELIEACEAELTARGLR